MICIVEVHESKSEREQNVWKTMCLPVCLYLSLPLPVCLSVCLSLTAYILSIHTCFREISLSNDMASSDVSIAILASKLCCLDTKWYRNFGELICLVKILLQLNENGETKKHIRKKHLLTT